MHPPLGFPRAPSGEAAGAGAGGGGGRRGDGGGSYEANSQRIWVMHTLVCLVQVRRRERGKGWCEPSLI